MKFLAMHITNQKLSFDIFTVGNLQNIFMEHDLSLGPIKILFYTPSPSPTPTTPPTPSPCPLKQSAKG